MILLLKAAIPGGAVRDLFAAPVPVEGHVRAGTYVAPYTAVRHKAPAQPRCLFCGEPEHVSVAEVWGHDFMLNTCCEARRDLAVQDMAEDPEYARQLLEADGIDGLRRVAFTDDGFGDIKLDFEPRIGPVSRDEANAFVAKWHRHNDPWPFCQIRAGIWNGSTLLGVVQAGAPTAQAYMAAFARKELCEVRRLCIREDLPKELTWKAASLLYVEAAKQAEERGYGKIITYTRADESGMSLRYARWKIEAETRGKTWNTPSRPRKDRGPIIDKVRWAKRLAPAPAPLVLVRKPERKPDPAWLAAAMAAEAEFWKPRVMERPIPLFRSVAPAALRDLVEKRAVHGKGNAFADSRPHVFFSGGMDPGTLWQGDEVDRQAIAAMLGTPLEEAHTAAWNASKAAEAALKAWDVRPGKKHWKERHGLVDALNATRAEERNIEKERAEVRRALCAKFKAERDKLPFSSVVLETKPMGGGLAYSNEWGMAGMSETEYGFPHGHVRLEDIKRVHLVKDRKVIGTATPAEALAMLDGTKAAA